MSSDLPTFLVVGAAKSGTTSLWEGLRRHPEVFLPSTKEIHFFDDDDNWSRGAEWYRTFFRLQDGRRAVGEATPSYLASPAAPARMAETVPHARLIAIFRDPVKRAYSSYFHMRYYGWEHRSFDQAVAEELRAPDWDLWPHYLAGGRYAAQLERLAEHFARAQILTVLLDDLRSAPVPTFAGVCMHIGVDPALGSVPAGATNTFREVRFERVARKLPDSWLPRRLPPNLWKLVVRMFTRTGGAPPPMDPGTRKILYDAFAEENDRLARWLGRDLPKWAAS